MTTQEVQALEDYVVLQNSGTLEAASGTIPFTIDTGNDILEVRRIKVIRGAGDATNFGIELRDDSSGTADDDNRWYYLTPAARIIYDGTPSNVEYVNRVVPPNRLIYVLIPFSGGTAIPQTYQATLWIKRIRQHR